MMQRPVPKEAVADLVFSSLLIMVKLAMTAAPSRTHHRKRPVPHLRQLA
jgi:hypothetical protein